MPMCDMAQPAQRNKSQNPMDHECTSLWEHVVFLFVMTLLQVFRIFSDYVAYPVLSALKSGRSKELPRADDQILLMSATDLAEKIRSGELSSRRVVMAFIKRLNEVNPILNAVTDERYRAALDEATEVDAMLQQCRADGVLEKIRISKPFLGVPITTKNAAAVKDLGNEAGMCLKKGTKASEDSAPIALMRASGAIPLAVTNTPEMCLWVESNNPLFGRTSNPYNTNRTCGGSSGGEGAVLASCGSPFGIGTDFAGSIRIPAAYNGIFGLKPTRETTDLTGHFPLPKDILLPLANSGPMCKYAKDLRPFLKALVGPSNAQKMMLDSTPSLEKLKVLYIEDFNSPIITPVREEIRKRTESAALHLGSLSQSVPQIAELPKLVHGFEIYMSYIAKADCPSAAQELTLMKGCMSIKTETAKLLIGRSNHTLPVVFAAFLEQFVKKTKGSSIAEKFFSMSAALEAEIESLLGDNGVLVCPTLPDVAPYHDLSLLRTSMIAHTGIWNLLGFPAVTVPMGLSKEGMPIGVTVVAGKFQDNICCEAALELENKFGGWIPPFKTSVDIEAARNERGTTHQWESSPCST